MIEQKNIPQGLTLEYRANLEGIGETSWVPAGKFIGTKGQWRNMKGFAIRLQGPEAKNYSIYYQARLDYSQWPQALKSDGEFAGDLTQETYVNGLRIWLVRRAGCEAEASVK